jgi:hypothetical protein
MTSSDDFDAPDLRLVSERLEAARPRLTPLELDAAKQRIRARAATPARRRTMKGQPMKSRVATLMMLVVGAVLSTGGVGLAISGQGSSNTNAAISQYSTATPSPTPEGGVLGEQNNGGGNNGGTPSGGGLAGEQNSAQPQRQVEAGAQGTSGSQLPFTGFAAIPVLIVGLVLTAGGLVLRRRSLQD